MSAAIDCRHHVDLRAAGRAAAPRRPRSAGSGSFVARKPLGAVGGATRARAAARRPLLRPGIAPYPYDVGEAGDRLQGPSLAHLFGTDANGRDMLSRIIWGARISVDGRLRRGRRQHRPGLTLGVLSGYFGGWVDLLVQRLVDVWISFPALVLLVSLVAVVGPGLWSVTIILGILLAPGTSRVVRSAVHRHPSLAVYRIGALHRGGPLRAIMRSTSCRMSSRRSWCWRRCSLARRSWPSRP